MQLYIGGIADNRRYRFRYRNGTRAPIDICGATYGNSTKEESEKQGLNYIIDSFRDLNNVI